jgi:hypothetical protein
MTTTVLIGAGALASWRTRAAARSIDFGSADRRERDIAEALTTKAVTEATRHAPLGRDEHGATARRGPAGADRRNGQVMFTADEAELVSRSTLPLPARRVGLRLRHGTARR